MKYQNFYQVCLILTASLVVMGLGVFLYKELFPEYKVYQHAYRDLEAFRSTYTGEKAAPFDFGIKQILTSNDSNGPEVVDRCISCHVTLDLTHFSKTRVAKDLNGQVILNAAGSPVLETNPDYIWKKIDEAELKNQRSLQHLKTVTVDGKNIDLSKVLVMHPLIGAETRPFEYHPKDKYGCTSCHSGNGRSLVAIRAHGPVYDEDYEAAFHEKKPEFCERDAENDPKFSKMYNNKPSHDLVFQTNPILAGPLISARCAECHLSSSQELKSALDKFAIFTGKKEEEVKLIQKGYQAEKTALTSLLSLQELILEKGREGAIDWLNEKNSDVHLAFNERESHEKWLAYIKQNEETEVAIRNDVAKLLGSEEEAERFLQKKETLEDIYTRKEKDNMSERNALKAFERAPNVTLLQDKEMIQKMGTDVDRLIVSYSRGKELFINQGCYGCHRIAGFSRAAIGPDLTKAGFSYPWYLKESIVWPQADLPSSTMPNFLLDHDEVGDLMAFLMAQKGGSKAISEMDYQIKINEWEAGKKMPWEEAEPPNDLYNVRKGMAVFAKEGCAACHRLQGFESNVAFKEEGDKKWFSKLFPEQIAGSTLAKIVSEKAQEIDEKLLENPQKTFLLDELDSENPELLLSFYSNFKFAFRAKNTEYRDSAEKLTDYKKRLKRVFMKYIQEHGLGRDVAPHLNWSGVYRDNAWLLGHFHNPSAHTPRSLMPVMPFDDSKFYMLSHMLHDLGKKNRDQLKMVWKKEGFSPAKAYETLCSQCHGEYRQGTGIVAEWIYPIPKNLKNPIFLAGLSKERAIDSIAHGVKGTPMPPWGEMAPLKELGDQTPVLTNREISELVDWIYQGLPPAPRQEKVEEFEKWHYSAQDVVREMKEEGKFLHPQASKDSTIDELVADYFDISPNPIEGPDENIYSIKEKYFTTQNFEEGQKYFLVNCAPCHGKEGTGTGLRAASMVEAKPRILTNIPWLKTRDDLRLLRSIKYGVAGTAMIPWGDQTSSRQRMQLAIFIRNLAKAGMKRDLLEEILYDKFDIKVQNIDLARNLEFERLENDEKRLQEIERLVVGLIDSDVSPQKLANLFVEKVQLTREKEKALQLDGRYKELIDLMYQEKKIYAAVGAQVLAIDLPLKFADTFFEMVKSNPVECAVENHRLILKISQKNENLNETLLDKLIQELGQRGETLQKEMVKLEISKDASEKIVQLKEDIMSCINLKTKMTSACAKAKELRETQVKIYESLN